ncbi:MAG: ionic transporter y4hA, partial [Nocardioides sp.]
EPFGSLVLAVAVTVIEVALILTLMVSGGDKTATLPPVFAGVTSLGLWGMFVLTQTVRHRDFFLPVVEEGSVVDEDQHAEPPTARTALASIGLTVPAIAVASIWLDGPLELGLGPVQMVLLLLTVIVSVLTIVPGRATRLEGAVHLALLGAFVFLSISP